MIFIGNLSSSDNKFTVFAGEAAYLSAIKIIDLDRLKQVWEYVYKNVFSTWSLLLLIFIITTLGLLNDRRKKKNLAFSYITFLFVIFVVVGTIGFSIIYPGWQEIPDSARRMGMILLPMLIYSISFF